jgi:hypothetical protein
MTLADKYITALYWSLSTMSTVGYGDVSPQTMQEQFVTIVAMLLACGTFGYTIGTIGAEFSKYDSRNRQLH